MQDIEKAIIEKVKNADVASFEIIFRSNFDVLYRYALSFTGDSLEAEDLVQELFIWLWENKQYIKTDMSLKAYLIKILQNRALNKLKHEKVKQKYQKENSKIIEEEEKLQKDYIEYYQENSSSENIEIKISTAIETLPEQCKKIFKLNRFEGLKYREISDKLDISLSTVKNQMSIALRKLQEILKKS